MGYLFDAINRARQGKAPASRPPGNTHAVEPPAAAAPPPPTAAEPQAVSPAAAAAASEPLGAPAAPSPEPAVAAQSPAPPFQPVSTQDSLAEVDERIVALLQASSVLAEEYRSVRTSILARWQNKRHLVHTITSATPLEGKTITSLNLGLSFAELRNRRTLVLEADLRLPQFSRLLGLPRSPGLVDLLEEKAQIDQTIRSVGQSPVHLIAAGDCGADKVVQLLSKPAMGALLARLRRVYDHVIIDTPPVIELADAGILGTLSDDVLLTVRMGRTPRPLVAQALRILVSYNAPVAGFIATDQQHHHGGYYHKYGGYRYYQRYYARVA